MNHGINQAGGGIAPAGGIKVRRKRLAAVAILAAATLLLAGCASTGASAGDSKTVLKVYGWKGGDAEPANVAKINAAFEKANPNITLKYEFIPSATYPQRVQ